MKIKALFFFLVVGLFSFTASAQSLTTPSILYFTADTNSLNYPDVEGGTAAANFSWKVIGLTDDFYLQMHAWVNAQWGLVGEKFEPEKTDRIVIAHPQDFGLPTYRLSVVNTKGEIVAASFLQLRYSAPDPDQAPQITEFSADLSEINTSQLADNKVFVPIHWAVSGRWPEVNPVFEQVMPDGTIVSVELPRHSLWIPASGKGLVAPRATAGQPVVLQIRLEDVYTGQSLATRQLSIPVSTSAVVSSFTPDTSAAGHAYPDVNNHFDATASAAPINNAPYDINTPGYFFTVDKTQVLPSEQVTLSWNAPNASLVWIEMHDAGKSGCMKIYHDPEVTYGPYSASGSLTVPISSSYTYAGVWFSIYIDRYAPAGCSATHPPNPTPALDRLSVTVINLTPVAQTSSNIPLFSADTSQQPDGSYESVPGEWVTLHWSADQEIYITAPGDFDLQGPLPASGELQVCPTSGGTTYTLYAGGQPGTVPGTNLFIYVPSSLEYPAYQAGAQTCWSSP